MKCPYCEETELIFCGYYICPHCKLAMIEDELAAAIRANKDAECISKLTGCEVIKATKQKGRLSTYPW